MPAPIKLTGLIAGALLLSGGGALARCDYDCADITTKNHAIVVAQKMDGESTDKKRKSTKLRGTQQGGGGGGAGVTDSARKSKMLNPQPEPPGVTKAK
jgi:hypothetical protein